MLLERDAMQTKSFKLIYYVLADEASSFCSWNSTQSLFHNYSFGYHSHPESPIPHTTAFPPYPHTALLSSLALKRYPLNNAASLLPPLDLQH